MCGIIGTINIDLDDSLLEMIHHRGPDSKNKIHAEVGRHTLSLGHTRLAIVDLSTTANQPMLTPNKGSVLIFNGEIYNHLEIRNTLGGANFKSHSDTETLLHYIAKTGTNNLNSLNGIFAFAYLDKAEQKLFLVRDPYGVKPLYYFYNGNTFAFCSELKPLAKLSKVSISQNNVAELLRLRYLPAPKTLFKEIYKVRPGHILEIDLRNNSLKLSESQFLSKRLKRTTLTFNEAVEQYGKLFDKAIERQLMSDVEVGLFLSGGIDSALVAQYANQKTDYKIKAFTVGFKEKSERDEINAASQSAKLMGLEHIPITLDESDFFSAIEKGCNVVEEPLATTSIVPFMALCEKANQYVKVVLTGQGADEPLGGYGRYSGALLFDRLPASLAQKIPTELVKRIFPSNTIERGLHAAAEPDLIQQLVKTYEVFSTQSIEALCGIPDYGTEEDIRYYYELLDCNSINSKAEKMMSLDMQLNLADDLLLYTDKISMHYSLECRVPILDHELIKFIQSLPLHYKVNFFKGKIIHKAFAKKVLPKSIVNRKKLGFQSPTNQWFTNSSRLKDILLSNTSKLSRILDINQISTLIDEQDNGKNRERHLFLLMALNYWCDQFI